MSNKQLIIDEIVNKISDWEGSMSGFLEECNEWSDLFTIKKPKKKANQFSRPRTPETFRAVNALGTMMYRMLTSQDPFFETVPMDLTNPSPDLYKVQKTLETQVRIAETKRHLLKSLMQTTLMGTTIVEEPFEWMKLNPMGRKMPVTKFVPRSLLQIGFDRNTYDIEKSDWLYTTDKITKYGLKRLAETDATGGTWSKGDINDAISAKGEESTNQYITDRRGSEGYSDTESQTDINQMEMVMFYGKLDTLNDGIEYICGLVNRKYLVRFHANKDQTGRRPFRVAKWIEWELMPHGLGIGRLLASHQRSIDANRQKVETGITFNNMHMMMLDRGAGINKNDFKIMPLKVIESDGTNGLKPIETSGVGIVHGLKLDEILKQEFRAASGATDTLQAIMTDGGTLGEVSIAQNEAVRNISVKAEIIAESLMRKHLEQCHINNYSNVSEPFVISGTQGPVVVYPTDLAVDVDFIVKITTDKDFRPQRTKDMIQVLQVMTSIRNSGDDELAKPIYKELFRSMDINPDMIDQIYAKKAEERQQGMQQAMMVQIAQAQAQQAEAQAKGGTGGAEAAPGENTATIPVRGPDVSGSVNQEVPSV